MKITVIIPTYNAASYLDVLLAKLKEQTISFELIIIHSSSQDDTVKIAKQYTKNILTIPTDQFDHGGTRTKAAKTAQGDIIVFLTQDALPYSNDTIESLIDIFKTPSVAATYGRQLAYEKTSIFGKHLRHFNYPINSSTRTLNDTNKYGIKTAFLSDSFAAYRK
jgi:rhamnosyltransferase